MKAPALKSSGYRAIMDKGRLVGYVLNAYMVKLLPASPQPQKAGHVRSKKTRR